MFKFNFKISLAVISLLFILMPASTGAQNIENFKFSSFEGSYYLSKDETGRSQLKVVETLVAEFPYLNQNKGIIRAIPKKYDGHDVSVNFISLTRNGQPEPIFDQYENNNNLVIETGTDEYLFGSQKFEFTYTLQDVIKNFGDHQEFYWDINGDQWEQSFSQVSASVLLDDSTKDLFTGDVTCFEGVEGSSKKCGESRINGNVASFTSSSPLAAGQNLSLVMKFQAGSFAKYSPPLWQVMLMIISFISPLFVFIFMFSKWYRHGRDQAGRGVIVPQYKPEDGMNPILASYILDEKMSNTAISATMIDLCIKGYVKIYEVEKKNLIGSSKQYEVELVKLSKDLSPEHNKVLQIFFSGNVAGERVNLNDQKNKLYSKVNNLQNSAAGRMAGLGYFVKNPISARAKYAKFGTLLFLLSAFGLSFQASWSFMVIPIVISSVIILLFNHIMPARTQKGSNSKEYLLGLKDYMQLAEADRIKFLQSPETAEKINTSDNKQMVELYEALLPYAMLFKIEKDWAKQFANLYSEGQSPNWYSGSHAFNAAVFSSALTGFSSTSSASFTAPSSSSSSGFGGGGFSGGGGGGGGGGGR